jgi:hypothetical protein
VAFDGANFLVAWGDDRGGYSDIYGARVTPQGTVLDPSGFVISQAAGYRYLPALGFDGASFLVVWQDQRGGSYDIYGARVTPQGTVLDSSGIAVSTAANDQWSPAVAFDGAKFLVIWEDYRNNRDTSDIYGARVSPAGSVLDEFPVVTQERNQRYPALASGPGSQMFLVYEGWAGTVGGKTYNADRIWGKFGPFPGVEEDPKPQAASYKLGPSIVRGVLNLQSEIALLDISGRKVLDLRPGANNVGCLSPGVYFVVENGSGVGRSGPCRTMQGFKGSGNKVIVTK